MEMVSSTWMNILVSRVFFFKCVFKFPVPCIDLSVSLCISGDMYSHNGDPTEPEWVKTEREQFTEFRDKNKDGRMDKDETRDWILPSDYDHAEAEAKHLLYESDADQVKTW